MNAQILCRLVWLIGIGLWYPVASLSQIRPIGRRWRNNSMPMSFAFRLANLSWAVTMRGAMNDHNIKFTSMRSPLIAIKSPTRSIAAFCFRLAARLRATGRAPLFQPGKPMFLLSL